jgi:drug/metabolite transporter (DMT)-like permease
VIAEPPDLMSVLPYLAAPAALAVLLLIWARRRGATWTQVQLSFTAAMVGAFLTAAGWIVAAYISGEALTTWRILGSELLVAGTCGVMAFFGTMPERRDLTPEADRTSDAPGK